MSLRTSPAALPIVGFVLGVGLSGSLLPCSIALPAMLVGCSTALGGPGGAILVATGIGLVVGGLDRREKPTFDRDLVTDVTGTVCGYWRERRGFATRSARFCPLRMRQGRRLLLRPPPIWLDLPTDFPAPPPGAVVRGRGVLSRFPGFANEDPAAPGPWRLRVKSRLHLLPVFDPSPPARWSAALRARVERAFMEAGPPTRPGLALARGFVLGDEGGLTESQRRAMRRAGLAHLLAVSGFNVTVVAALAGALFGFGGRVGRLAAPLLAVLAYLAAVGPEPSLLRAAVMATAGVAVLALRRAGSALQALALAAAALVAYSPEVLADPGFRLSFGATAGLIVLTSRWQKRFARLPTAVGTGIAATLAAQVGALPWSVASFAQFSPVSPLLNLLAAPWATLWMLGAMAWTVTAAIVPAAATWVLPFLDLAARPMRWIEHLPASPWAALWIPGGVGGGLLAGLAIGLLIDVRWRPRLLLLAVVALAQYPVAARRSSPFEVVFLDVGQGDAAVVRHGGFTLLIDGGGGRSRNVGRRALWPFLSRHRVGRVDVALLSHPDLDHCGGLADLTDFVPIRELWIAPSALKSPCPRRLAARVGRVRLLRGGDRLERSGVDLDVLHADSPDPGASDNADSVVVRLTLGGKRLLFMGDLERRGELRLLGSVRPLRLRCDLIKVAHHGSKTSSVPPFLAAARARLAIVSVGLGNAFGHPARSTLDHLSDVRMRVLRTDRDGEIELKWGEGAPWTLDLPASPRRTPLNP